MSSFEDDLVRRAVAVVHDQFEKDAGDLRIIVREISYAHLYHARTRKLTFLRELKDLEWALSQRLSRIPGAHEKFELTLREKTPAAWFRAYLDAYVDALAELADRAFKHLFEVGCEHEEILPRGPADWSVAEVMQMIHSQRESIVELVRRVCPDLAIDWGSWQAPRFLLMRPAMHLPYDSSRAWELLDNKFSRKLVEDFAGKAVTRLEDAVKETAGDAILQTAKRPTLGSQTFQMARGDKGKMTSRSRSKRRGKIPTREEKRRQEIIFKALSENLEGKAYCGRVGELGLETHVSWQEAGCPSSYLEAYRTRNSPWKKRIQDEKSRMRLKLKSLQ